MFSKLPKYIICAPFQQKTDLEVQDSWKKIVQYIGKFTTQQTGNMLCASPENTDLHFCGELAARYHIGKKQRREHPVWGTNRQVQCPGNNSCL